MPAEILDDIKDIATKRPDLSADEWLIVEKAAAYYKALLKPEVRQELEVEYSQRYADYEVASQAQMKTMVAEKFDEWKASQAPLDSSDLKKLLSQEYESFELRVLDTEKKTTRSFRIRELPKAVEVRFVDLARKMIVPYMEHKSWAEFTAKFDESFASKIVAILELVPNSLDLLCEICAIALDPFKEENIDAAWVGANLSLRKIQAIIILQIEANKYRDFFLYGFRWFQSLKVA